MEFETIQVEKEDTTLIATLNRPPMNALNGQLVTDIGALIDEANRDEGLRAVIMMGSGEKAFCAGADLSAGFGDDVDAFVKRGQDNFEKVNRCKVPVIAAINGHCLGGGLELALACHYRIMQDKGYIGLPESSLGILPGYGGTQRLPRVVGRPKAIDLMVFGKRLSAQEALEIGLVDQVCAAGEAPAKAKELAAALAERAPIATRLIIDAVNRGVETSLEEGLNIERANFAQVIKTADATEGIKAFFSKARPEFKGK